MTEGYRVIRFRGRYYCFWNRWDSYPHGLGKKIVSEIPIHPEAYQQWLAERREEALGWHLAVQNYLCLQRAEIKDDDWVHDGTEPYHSQFSKLDEPPWGVATETLPNFVPPSHDDYILWIYTIDLDNEVFTIDNGAHLHLNRIPRPNWIWIRALALACHGDRVLLPRVPEEAIADLVVKPASTIASMLDLYENLDIRFVKAKGLNAFSTMQRHGPLLRARVFKFFQSASEEFLEATLLSWRPDEFPFRETAYAILCLASASFNLSFIPTHQVSQMGRIGYADFKPTEGGSEKAEFLAHLGVGRHLEGVPPGSSPDSEMYWFDGALVSLAAQLLDCPEVFSGAVARVVEYCRSQRPNQCVNAILTSIEHVVLMRIYPGGEVERTELLLFFDIPNHISMAANGRYHSDYLEKLQESERQHTDYLERLQIRQEKTIIWREAEQRKWQGKSRIESGAQIEELQSEQYKSVDKETMVRDRIDVLISLATVGLKSLDHEDADDTNTTFMALTAFLEASSRQQMPPSKPKEGIFPTEIYETILLNLEDLQTYHACMQVSRSFRDLSQRNGMMMNGVLMQAIDTSKAHCPTDASIPAFRMKTLATGQYQDVTVKNIEKDSKRRLTDSNWEVVVGSEYNRRSLVHGLVVALDPIDGGKKG